MKRLFTILAAALALTLSWEAAAQTDFYEVVPKHEFTINGFGGISTLQYSVPERYGFSMDINWNSNPYGTSTKLFDPSSLAGGGGLGWNIHFSPHWGLMLGADLAIYRSRIAYPEPTGELNHGLVSGYLQSGRDPFTGEMVDSLAIATLYGFSEAQTVYSVQVPLMVKFMTGIGRKKANQFYVAAGARIGFNVANSYSQVLGVVARGTTATNGIPSGISFAAQQNAMSLYDVWGNGPASADPTGVAPAGGAREVDVLDLNLGRQWDATGPRSTVFPDGGAVTTEKDANGDISRVLSSGQISNLALLNVMASAEIGFRWALGNGWGLYTGLYVDYGLLPQTKATSRTGIVHFADDGNWGSVVDHTNSILAASKLPSIVTNADGRPDRFVEKQGNIVEKVNTFAAGVKLRLAFGSVKKKPVEPVIIVVRDTVTQTNTVVVRDTVTRTNTVVVRDTVTNVIRDTVTIIKEIPVEIQKTMMELSNTMFDFDKDVIKEAAKGPLNKVVAWLQENPNVKVEISGHTDSKGSEKYNQDLSERRARAVYNYFISQGVDKFRLAYAGYGKSRPIATNETEEGRQLNRRVELNVIQ